MLTTLALSCTSACGGSSTDGGLDRGQAAPEVASPFEVEVPDGWTLLTAGIGEQQPQWGEDGGGTDEPATLLTEGVVVSSTGYEGYQGGLDQASRGAPIPGGVRTLSIDGRAARYAPATVGVGGDADGPPELVVDRGDDLAVRVAGPGRSLEELQEIAAAVAPVDRHDLAPDLPDPPLGLEVVGHVDAQGALATHGTYVVPGRVAGGSQARSLGWVDGEDQLGVVVVPGATLEVEAVEAAFPFGGVERRVLDDGTVVAVAREGTMVLLEAPWGDVVVASSSSLTTDELVAVARSARQVDEARWAALVEAAAGGPGLQPDPTRTELVRGETGGVRWLLQTGGPGSLRSEGTGGIAVGPDGLTDRLAVPDECLKLEGDRRACPVQGSESAELRASTFEEPAVVVVTVRAPGSSLRLTRADASTLEADLVAVPGHDTLAGVLEVDGGLPRLRCSGALADGEARAEVLDDAGAVLRCLDG